jgi:hypothetical protein
MGPDKRHISAACRGWGRAGRWPDSPFDCKFYEEASWKELHPACRS